MAISRRARRQTFRARGPKPRVMWAPFGTGETTLPASGAVAFNVSGLIKASMPSLAEYTAAGLRLITGVRFDGDSALVRILDFGITVMSQRAFDQGIASVPDPELDDVDWWIQKGYPYSNLEREHAAGVFTTDWKWDEIHLRSARRLDAADQLIVAVWKNRQAASGVLQSEGGFFMTLH